MRKIFPHVSEIEDPATQKLVRLLWDRLGECEERIMACEATIKQMQRQTKDVSRVAAVVRRHESQLR
jgi:predicted GIY-YIG superfamily endonuclease